MKSGKGKRKAVDKEEAVAVMEEKKKALFERIWSEEDEIALIKAMIKYVEENRIDPISDVINFHEFVKPSLTFIGVNIAQMTTKMRRLKEKFKNNADRIENNGNSRLLSNPHEKIMYEFSQSLWGGRYKTKKSKENQKPKGSSNSKEWIRFPLTDDDFIKRGIQLAKGSEKAELEKEWKELQMEEFKLNLEKLDLMKEQGELVWNVMKKSGEDEPTDVNNEDEDENDEDTRTNQKKPKRSKKSAHDKVANVVPSSVQDVKEEMSHEKNTETRQVKPKADIKNEIPSSPIRADQVGSRKPKSEPVDFVPENQPV